MRRADRQAKIIRGENRPHCDQLSRSALGVREMRFADFFAPRNDDTSPTDHRSAAESKSDRDSDPKRNKLRAWFQLGKESDRSGLFFGIIEFALFIKFAQGPGNQVEIAAKLRTLFFRNIGKCLFF